MEKIFSLILLSILSFSLYSCKKESASNEVALITKDIFNTPNFVVNGGEDIGVVLLGNPDIIKTITLTNNSSFPFTEMEFIIDDKITANIQFTTNSDTGETAYPGGGGTCQKTLLPKSSCTINLTYKPTIEGEFSQLLTWNYKNHVEAQTESKTLTVMTGRPASLVFTNDKTKYNFGVLERTDITTLREEILTIKNAGGLPAKNIITTFEATSGSAQAFKITENSCGTEIKNGDECQIKIQYTPQNYDYPTANLAPDGSTDYLEYKKQLTLDYIKDPFNRRAKLNSYYSFISTTIEGRMNATGLSNISFTPITVGTEETKKFSFANEGFKEAILKRVTIVRSGNAYAYCYKNSTNQVLDCEDALTNSPIELHNFPFLIKDNESCLISKSDLDYTRLSDKSLSKTLKMVSGKDPDDPLVTGELCSFDLTFHPSVKYIQGKSEDKGKTFWKDTLIFIEYDSTWKNNIVLFNDQTPFPAPLPSDDVKKAFNIAKAEYKYAGRMDILFHSLNGVEISNSFGSQAIDYQELFINDPEFASPSDTDNIFLSDIGEIALISGSIPNYKDFAQKLIWRFQNIGDQPVKNIQTQIDDSNVNQGLKNFNTGIVNDYYEVTANTCSLLESGTNCNILSDFTPISGVISPGVSKKEYMFDQKVVPLADEGYRRIVLTYDDGALFEDERNPDGSFIPRKKQRYEVRLKGKLVSKGLLSFSQPHTTGDLTLSGFITGNTYYHDIEVKNIGTGNVHRLAVAENPTNQTYITNLPSAEHPFTFIPHPTASKDCLDILDSNGQILPGNPTLGNSTAASISADGGTCLFRVKLNLPRNANFLKTDSDYDSYEKQRRPFTRMFSNKERLEWRAYPLTAQIYSSIMLQYNPNQDALQSDSATNNVLSTSSGRYTLAAKFSTQSDIIIDYPSPGISARTLIPEYSVDESEAGGNASENISRQYRRRDGGIFELKNSSSHLDYLIQNSSTQLPSFSSSTTLLDENTNDYDYLIHFGTFNSGETNPLSFSITKVGDNAITNGTIVFDSATPNTEFTFTSGNGAFTSNRSVELNFQAIGKGLYHRDIIVEFENGWKTETSTLVRDGSTNQVVRKKIRVMAEVLDNTDFQSIEVSIADVPVTPGIAGVSIGVPDYSSLTFNSYDLNTKPNIVLEDVKGGLEGFTEKQIKIKNNKASLNLDDLYLTVGTLYSSASFQGVSKSPTKCYNTSDVELPAGTQLIGPNEYCTMNIRFAAQNGQTNISDAKLHIAHMVSERPVSGEKQYKHISLPLVFNAFDPATLNFANLQLQDIAGVSDVGIIELGFYSNTHIILDDTGSTDKTLYGNIENTVTNKASLLAQYEDHQTALGNTAPFTTPQSGSADWTTIYTKINGNSEFNKNVTLKANGPCFFGDDASNGAIPDNEKGFNNSSTGQCQIQATYHAKPEDFLESTNNYLLNPQEELILLKYYSYNRISTNFLGLTFQGMIEPPRASFTESKPYTNISVTHNGPGLLKGSVQFSWPDANIGTPSLGNIVGYKILFSGIKNKLNNVFNFNQTDYNTETAFTPTKLYYIDHMDTVNKEITINDLPELAYYYFRVIPIREYTSDKTYRYYSHNPSSNARLEILIPNEHMIYNADENVIIDKATLDLAPMFKSAAIDACNDDQINVLKNGSIIQLNKNLINQTVLDIILDDDDRNNPSNSLISSYQVDFTSHWISDPAVDITPIFPDVSNDFGYNEDTTKYYFKCQSCSPKTTLSWIYGLVEDIGKPATYVFSDENFLSAKARCYLSP